MTKHIKWELSGANHSENLAPVNTFIVTEMYTLFILFYFLSKYSYKWEDSLPHP